jgi:transposase
MKTNPNLEPEEYFRKPENAYHKQYRAMMDFYYNNMTAAQIAEKHGYTVSTVYSMSRDLKIKLKSTAQDPYFKTVTLGRKLRDEEGTLTAMIVALRKKYLSVPEIKSILEAAEINVSLQYIDAILKKEGFARLPRRDNETKQDAKIEIPEKLQAEKSRILDFSREKFTSQLAGLLCFLPFVKYYELDKAIAASTYPETESFNRTVSICSFLALKLSNIKRYSADDLWCMDRGMGLFAGLNVLPKTAWFSSYSSAVNREMNIDFLKSLYGIWHENGMLSETANIDFTAVPYWGDADALENNWSGKRGKALASMLALLVQDPDTGIICYGDMTLRHAGQDEAILEFLDFHQEGAPDTLKYLVFDSKATTYQNLDQLNKQGIKFVTIRRRGAKLVERINKIKSSEWQKIRIKRANGKGRNVKVSEETARLKDYEGPIRQIYLSGHGKIKPAIIITNDFDPPVEEIVRKYSKRWMVEKEIAEHVDFFHFNRNSSGMVIKVDFDLTMTILAHNLYRLFARDLEGYSHCDASTIFDKFICNAGEIEIGDTVIDVKLKRKRHLPMLLEHLDKVGDIKIPWLNDMKIVFSAATTT